VSGKVARFSRTKKLKIIPILLQFMLYYRFSNIHISPLMEIFLAFAVFAGYEKNKLILFAIV